MSKKQNYYQILGVSQSATLEEIRKSYYRLARQYHPDVNPDDRAAEAFKEITRIYEILTDPIARRDYDQELAKKSPEEIAKERDPEVHKNSQEHQAWELYQHGLKKSQKLDYQGAIADYTEALKLNPQLVEAYYQRGFARSQLSNDRGAFADYTAALKLNHYLPEIYYYRGLTRFKLANISGSLEDFDRALALNPQYGEVYYQRGLVYQEIKENPAAIANFQQALQVFSRQGDRFNYRRTLKALESIQKTLKIFDRTPPILTWPLETFKTWGHFAFNPRERLFPAFIRLDPSQAIAVAIGFSLIFNVCFVIGFSHWQKFYHLTNYPIFLLIIVGLLPILSLTGASGLMRIILQANGSFAGDLFMATASLLPLGLWVLLGGLMQNFLAWVILGIFAMSYTILTTYTGCHEISQISATKSALTVPIILTLGVLPVILIL